MQMAPLMAAAKEMVPVTGTMSSVHLLPSKLQCSHMAQLLQHHLVFDCHDDKHLSDAWSVANLICTYI